MTGPRATSPAGLRTWLEPRTVRYYPSRGVTYESHLAPPPHLVGLRIAALDALLEADRRTRRRSSSSAPSRCRRRFPTRRYARTPSSLKAGELLDLDETARRSRRGRLRARRPGRGPGPVRDPRRAARRVPRDRGPGRASRPVRRRDRVAALVLDVHAALARRRRGRRGRARGRARRGAPRARRDRRARGARPTGPTSPSCSRSRTSTRSSTLAPADASVLIAGEEDVAPALADHWQDVCAAFHDTDAHHLYVGPDEIAPELERARPDPAVEHRPGPAVLVPRPEPPTSPRAASRRPSPSSRSSPARATGRSSRSRGAARASGPRTTSGGSRSAGSTAPSRAGPPTAR